MTTTTTITTTATPKQTKAQWKSTYKTQKLKEKTLSSALRQLCTKFQKHYLHEDYDNLNALYGGGVPPPDTAHHHLKLDKFIVQLDKLKLHRSNDKTPLIADCSSLALAVSKLSLLIEEHASLARPNDDTNAAAHHANKLAHIERLSKQIDDDLVRTKESHKHSLQLLDAEQKLLEKDLNVCHERINLMERQLKEPQSELPPPQHHPTAPTPSSKAPTTAHQNTDGNLPQEIQLFNHFIATNGGKYGGWDPEDHQQFVALRSKFAHQSFINEAAKRIPGQTPFTIQQHLTWYKLYLTYKKQKKDAIKHWKEQKEQHRIHMLKQREEKELKELDEQDEQKLKLQQLERKRKKQRIKQWREQKQREQFQLEQEMLQKQEQERKHEQLREQEHQEALKAQLLEYKAQKVASEKDKQLEEELSHKVRPPSAQDLRRLEERNLQLAKKRLELKSRKEREQHLREERLRKMAEAVHVDAPRDASRLTTQTAAHKSRVQDLKAHGAENKGAHNFNIRRVQHRAMPSWRRGA
eukprot:CAMPEP_0117449902 /NCGR_PEP_ID=MMETSP0759-20121206/8186_1 /TAXON_ID=63605 /ORGANISM="Percolomonas cosmopolitus, Strain WS" /LENGTH=523 /DNA_ID=CAMNT_0005242395 /DNA_START=3 /DNA_END=1574 /DNA_ORIENTATION=-